VGIQLILIFLFKKQIKKSALHIKQLNVIIIMILLGLIAAGSVMLYRFNLKITELSAYTEKAEDYINSIIFKENIRILFITVLFQTFCFMILLNRFQCEVAAPRVVLSFITVLFSLGICALKLIAPAGMICRINKSSDYSSKINQEEFYIDRSEMTVFRETDGGESPVYYSQSIEIYFGENKVCQTNSNYAYEKDDIENSEIDGYKILVIKNILAAFVDENGNTGYILADGEMSGKCMADFLDYNWVEKPYET
jgi:hypothetical protein